MLENIIGKFGRILGIDEESHRRFLAENPNRATIYEIAAGDVPGIQETEQKLDAILKRLYQDAEFGLYPTTPKYAKELIKTFERIEQEVNEDSFYWIRDKAFHIYNLMADSLQTITTKFAGLGKPNKENWLIRDGYALPLALAASAALINLAFQYDKSSNKSADNYSIDNALHKITNAIGSLGIGAAFGDVPVSNQSNAISKTVEQTDYGTLTFQQVLKDGVGGVDGLNIPLSVIVSPDGKNVYAAGYGDDAIAVFDRNQATGDLTFLEYHRDNEKGVDGLDEVSGVAISPDGNHVYCAGRNDHAIAIFDRNTTTGGLTFLGYKKNGVDGVDGIRGAFSVAVSFDGENVYVAAMRNNSIAVFERNKATGDLTFLEYYKDNKNGVDGLSSIISLKESSDGKNVYVPSQTDDAIAIFDRNTTTGGLTFLGCEKDGVNGIEGLDGAFDVALSPDNKHVYVVSHKDHAIAIFDRNTATGGLTFLGYKKNHIDGVYGISSAASVAVSFDGENVYVAGPGNDAIAVFKRNRATGDLTFLEYYKDNKKGVDGLDYVFNIALSPDDKYVYAVSQEDNAIAVFKRNTEGGPMTNEFLEDIISGYATFSQEGDRFTVSKGGVESTVAKFNGPVHPSGNVTYTIDIKTSLARERDIHYNDVGKGVVMLAVPKDDVEILSGVKLKRWDDRASKFVEAVEKEDSKLSTLFQNFMIYFYSKVPVVGQTFDFAQMLGGYIDKITVANPPTNYLSENYNIVTVGWDGKLAAQTPWMRAIIPLNFKGDSSGNFGLYVFYQNWTANSFGTLLTAPTNEFQIADFNPFYITQGGETSIKEILDKVITGYSLSQNYPNPFNTNTNIGYTIPKESEVEIKIYNILGRQIKHIDEGRKEAGKYFISWYGTNEGGILVPSGVYIYRIKANNFIKARKMLLIK